ncbi:MAG: carboxylating nicotinate-nucleotide diphosphorylase [Candidatus Eisenbacteria bacterium]
MKIDTTAEQLIRAALDEDLGRHEPSGGGDVTTDPIIAQDHESTWVLVADATGIIAGLDVALRAWQEMDRGIEMDVFIGDGRRVSAGDRIAAVRGRTRGIISGERVALNFLQRLSGVATATAGLAAVLEGTGTTLLDTRKTTPGMRTLEKQAVVLGGGGNHRMGLWDMALIKDNHIAAAGGIASAVAAVRAAHPDVRVEVEVTDDVELEQALAAGVDRVMLDNMTPGEMSVGVALARAHPSAPEIELSGCVTAETLPEFARMGADFISVGAITHSAPALDISLELGG